MGRKQHYVCLKNLKLPWPVNHSISEIDYYCYKHIPILLPVMRNVLGIFIAEQVPWGHVQLSCLFIYILTPRKVNNLLTEQ